MKPFDLEKALQGEPCVTRIGKKVTILASMTERTDLSFKVDYPLIGYIHGQSEYCYWTKTGRISLINDEAIGDIVGMWEKPRQTVTLTLPCPLKEPQDILYYFDEELVYSEKYIEGNEYQEKMLNCGLYFASEQDAQAWLDAMKNNRR